MTARDVILDRIRDALEGRERVAHPGRFEGWRPTTLAEPVDRFVALLEAAGGEVRRFDTQDDAAAWVRSFVAGYRAVSVGRLARWPLNHGAEIDERIDSADPGEAEVGVSLARAAVAETGSLLMSAEDGRRAQLLPRTHVVFVDPSTLYPTLADALEALADELPSAAALHSGPSKSADIGQVLVRGVHGPGRLVAVLMGTT